MINYIKNSIQFNIVKFRENTETLKMTNFDTSKGMNNYYISKFQALLSTCITIILTAL